MAYNVKFLKGSLEAYQALGTKDANVFYYAGNDLFLGEVKLSNGADLAAAILRIAANETDIDNLQKDIQALTGGETGSISGLISEAVNAAKVELRKEISANTTAINNEVTRATGIEAGLRTDVDAVKADYLKAADKTALQAEIDADVKVEADRAKEAEEAIDEKVEAIKADYLKAADKTELEGKITAEASRADAAEKVNAAAIAAVKEDVDAFFADADLTASAKDTLKELQEYIKSDETAASAMAESIEGVKTRVKAIEDDYLTSEHKAELEEAIGAKADSETVNGINGRVGTLESTITTKAAASDVTALTTRVTTAEGKITTLEGKVDVEKVSTAIATAKSEAITTAEGKASTAEANAKHYADTLATNYATAAQGTKADSALQVADIKTGSTNGTISVKGGDVAVKGLGSAAYTEADAYDAKGSASQALADAKAYTDGKASDYEVAGAAAAAETRAKAYADGLATNYDAAGSANAALTSAKAYTDGALTWGTIA